MAVLWVEFIVCSGIIVYCGTNLTRYGDVIAEKTGLGRAWIGLILMAGVTSLPELINGLSSVALAGVPDIAVGDVMGSCVFNLAILALVDLLILAIDDIFYKKGPLLADVSVSHALTGLTAILMTGIAIVAMTFGREKKTFLRPGWAAVALFLSYLVNIYLLYSLRGAK